jgi:hypothetical protein
VEDPKKKAERDARLTQALTGGRDNISEYELAVNIVQLAHKSFPIIYRPILDHCECYEDV